MLSPLKKIGISAALFLCSYHVVAQKTEPLALDLPKKKIAGSIYNNIKLFDLRPDTSGLGNIQTGMLNKQVKVIAQQPLQVQFNNILGALNDESAKSGELVLQLRQLAFSEITSAYSEKGYFSFGATLFAKKDSLYIPLQSIDTLATVSAMDVTNKNIRNGSEIISKFLSDGLQKMPVDKKGYTYDELIDFENAKKKTLPLYTNGTYADGFYSTYKSFGKQVPDGQIVLDGEELKFGKVKVADNNGKLKKLKPETVYAIVYKGKPYISTPFGYYLISKSDNNLFFTGKLTNNLSVDGAAMSIMFGAIGGAIAAASTSNNNPPYEVKIYYLTGDFIRIRQLTAAETH